MSDNFKVTKRKLTDYIPDMSNANDGSERGLQMIEDSLNQDGAGRSIVADKDGRLPAGNKTLEAAINAGFEDVIEVETDGHALIVHKRRDWDLTDPKGAARRYAYRDNRASEVSLNWNLEQILADVNAGVDLSHLWTGDELDALLADLTPPIPVDDPGAQVDRAAELQQKWQTSLGQLWTIESKNARGSHRLLCGDSTKVEDVARVMGGERADFVFADPPYGMDLDVDYDDMFHADKQHRRTGDRFDKVIGDDSDFDPRPVMTLFADAPEQFWWGADYYTDKIPNLTSGVFVVWDKRGSETMDEVVGNVYEMAWSKRKHRKCIARILWSGHHGMQHEDVKSRIHPTQKPVALVQWFLNRWGQGSNIVADPYGGSGVTMVACEQLGRQCRMIELEAKYVAVILQRMSDIGLTPRLVE